VSLGLTKPARTAMRLALARQELPTHVERRRRRLAAGLSLQHIADSLGVSRVTVSRWERPLAAGGREPRGEHLVAYTKVLTQISDALAIADLLDPGRTS
jgi:transcriptional regulator with XRE-family HTH domain